MGRLTFLKFALLWVFLFGYLLLLLRKSGSPAAIASIAALFLAAIFCIPIVVRRLHDVNQSGWFALLIFVPPVHLVLLLCLSLIPGTKGPNRFGMPPGSEPGMPGPIAIKDSTDQAKRRRNWAIVTAALAGVAIAIALAVSVLNKEPRTWDDASPKWSADGRQIAFSSSRDGNQDIFVMDADGSAVVQLTKESILSHLSVFYSSADIWPTWSPDGRRIAFSSARDNTKMSYVLHNIYVMDNDGAHVSRITGTEGGIEPAWSPDRKRIAFATDRSGSWDIYVMFANGANVVKLTGHGASDDQPAWSPDGRRIAFTSKRDGVENIYVMHSDGSDVVQLTRGNRPSILANWSPDGRRVAFASNRDGNFDIYAMDADGSNVARLTRTAASTMPAWSPDGRRIAFACDRSGHYRVCAMDADGSNIAQLTH
jgi:dipeptidyl aminopeptidase/acylaminoacyl peptidase